MATATTVVKMTPLSPIRLTFIAYAGGSDDVVCFKLRPHQMRAVYCVVTSFLFYVHKLFIYIPCGFMLAVVFNKKLI